MKFSFTLALVSAIKMSDKSESKSIAELLKPHEDLMCAIGGKNPYNPGQSLMQTDLFANFKWLRNQPGFYDKDVNSKSKVEAFDGEKAVNYLTKSGKFDKPMFIELFHPQCPHCKELTDEYEKLGQYV